MDDTNPQGNRAADVGNLVLMLVGGCCAGVKFVENNRSHTPRMPHPYWPMFDLVVRTPRLVVRLPTDEPLVALAALAAGGIHAPETMPFAVPWTDAPSPRLERAALQWWWRQRAEWSPDRWTFAGAVFVDGHPVGVQDLVGEHFGVLRSVSTGSWLGREHQNQGLGTEMRAAVLHLAFAGLGAVEAHSGAWEDNSASINVSRKFGYVDNGSENKPRRDTAARHLAFRLDRSVWESHRRDDISIECLDPCLELFGVHGG